MHKKYAHLLSPLKIGNIVFRNRLFTSATGLHSLQGDEPYPTEAIMTTFANKARGGAAMVTLHAGNTSHPFVPDGTHISYNIYSAYSRHYLAQLADIVHFYGAKASMELYWISAKPGYDVSAGIIGMSGKPSQEIPEEMMDEIADEYAYQAYVFQDLGYDMVMLHMGYCYTPEARFLSPLTNKRTDKYGGSIENRARFPMMIFDRIKQKCGRDFPIEVRISGSEPEPGGTTIEDSIKLARLLEGYVDLFQVHTGVKDATVIHTLGFTQPAPNLAAAAAIKRSGTAVHVATIGGYQDLDEMEDIIATGKADVISMARGWIADPNLGIKAYEGRGEDVVPCIKCDRCHDSACREHRTYVCSVNPTIGREHRLEKIVKPPTVKKKVAVVGGGPAGMQAALTAVDRGHDITLYEMNGVLGGQLNYSDYVSFKYSLNKFKKFLIRQVEKSKIKVCLNTKVDTGLLERENFDVIIGALGAEPVIPSISGVNGKNVITAVAVYGKEKTLANDVVVIGGGQVGCETALHLAMSGHKVTLLEMQDKLAPDASVLYRSGLLQQMAANDNLRSILNACCIGIGNEVIYKDAAGAEQKLKAGSVVIAAGMKPRVDEAIVLYDAGNRFVPVGDCAKVGNVENAMHTSFAAAILL